MRIHVARMHLAAFADKFQHGPGALVRRRRHEARAAAWVHQRRHPATDEPIVDEEVFFDWERRVAPFEIAGAIARHAMAQCEILRARRRANGIGLDKAEAIERCGQVGRSELAGDGQPPDVI
jgi:hypothetical protein